MSSLLRLFLVSLMVVLGACGNDNGKRFIAIGTGAVTGVYYPVGGAIATLIDQDPSSDLTASVESTGGSVFNINAVLIGDLEFGITQADKQYQAYHGQAEWADAGPQDRLRAVCSLHTEMVTLVATVDSGIATLHDLKGKRVNIGNPGSGHRGNAIDIFESAGIDWETELTAESIKAAEASKMLQDERIDAFFYTVGHPNGSISEATAGRVKVRFVPIEPAPEFWDRHPYYSKAIIPAKYYENAVSDADVPTIGMPTTLVTSADVADDVVYEVTKIIFNHLEALRAQHPALADLKAKTMLEGSSAPFHPGALRYYREAGLMP